MNSIYDPRYKAAMECLKNLRIEAKCTQSDLAKKLGCTQGYVSKYEQSQVRLDIIETRNVCLALGIPFENFISKLEKMLNSIEVDEK